MKNRFQVGTLYRNRFNIWKWLTVVLLASIMSFAFTSVHAETGGTFTLLVYMTGSDLETKGHAASKDILEMVESLPASSGIHILLEAGGAESWELEIDSSKNTRIEIGNGEWRRIDEQQSRNMADPNTLKDFLTWGCEYAPADRYGLILWDHGAGPMMGVCLDELYPDEKTGMNTLSLKELEEALRNSRFAKEKLVFIGFDACLMGSLEIASLVSPYAEYMIASQETEPASGWDYSFLKEVNSLSDGRTWGEQITVAYEESLRQTYDSATLSCLDLGKTEHVLAELETFFGGLTEQVTTETYPVYSRCRANAKIYGGQTTFDFDLVDLVDLVNRYEKKELANSESLREAIGKMVVSSCAVNAEHTNGLSIYYPFDNKSRYISGWSYDYQESTFSPAYRDFISRISEYYLHESLFSMTSDYQMDLLDDAGSIRVQMPLTESDASVFLRSRMMVLEKLAKDSYRLVYYNDQDIKETDRGISARYSGEALFAVNRDGEITAGPISYFPVENGVALYGILWYDWNEQYPVKIVYQKDEQGKLVFSQILTPQDGKGAGSVFLPSALDVEKSMQFEAVSFGPCDEGEGTLTSLNYKVYYPDYSVAIDLNDPDQELALTSGWTRNDRYVFLRLTDVKNETVCTDPEVIPNYTRLSVADPQELESGAGLNANLIDGSLVTGNDAGLMFTLSVQNQSNGSLILQTSKVTFNRDVMLEPSQFQSFRSGLATDETDEITVFVPLRTLQDVSLPDEIRETAITFAVTDEQGKTAEYTVAFPMTMDTAMIGERP